MLWLAGVPNVLANEAVSGRSERAKALGTDIFHSNSASNLVPNIFDRYVFYDLI